MFDVLLLEVIYMLQQKRKLQRPICIYFKVVNINFFYLKKKKNDQLVGSSLVMTVHSFRGQKDSQKYFSILVTTVVRFTSTRNITQNVSCEIRIWNSSSTTHFTVVSKNQFNAIRVYYFYLLLSNKILAHPF